METPRRFERHELWLLMKYRGVEKEFVKRINANEIARDFVDKTPCEKRYYYVTERRRRGGAGGNHMIKRYK